MLRDRYTILPNTAGCYTAKEAVLTAQLARAVDWRFFQKDGQWFARETNTMPQWAGSCWYYLRYLDPANARHLADPQIERYWMAPTGRPDAAPHGPTTPGGRGTLEDPAPVTGTSPVPAPPIVFGTDGWRGVIAEDYTFANVRRICAGVERAMARMPGWTSHVIEQHGANRLIRPDCFYTGPRDVAFVPIEKRS